MASRVLFLLAACEAALASAIEPTELTSWLVSEDGLQMDLNDAKILAGSEAPILSRCEVKLSDLQALRSILHDDAKVGLDMTGTQQNIWKLAHQHISPDKLFSLYYYLSSSYTLSGGLALPKGEAQSRAITMALDRAEPDQLRNLYKVMYGYSGLGFDQATARAEAMRETLAGADSAQFKETYTRTKSLQQAIDVSVQANLGGLAKRYAEDGTLYSAEEFQKYYAATWLTKWLAAPMEKRISSDKKAYTASSFSRHYGSSWSVKWRASPTATQVRLANDDSSYTLAQFASFYKSSWQSVWDVAPELPCAECAPYAALNSGARVLV